MQSDAAETKYIEKEPRFPQHFILALLKAGRHFGGNPIHGKTTMKSDFYLRSLTADLRYPECWCGAEGDRGGGSGWGLLCCFLTGCQEKFNGCGIWTGKKQAGSFRGSKDLWLTQHLCLCSWGWLHYGRCTTPHLARKSVNRFSTYECGASGEYLPATSRQWPPPPLYIHRTDVVLKLTYMGDIYTM